MVVPGISQVTHSHRTAAQQDKKIEGLPKVKTFLLFTSLLQKILLT